MFASAAQAAGPEGALDSRAWELVSPAAKNAGEVGAPGSEAAGALQAAAGGGAIAYGSAASFGEAEGAAPVSQYLSTRGASGWGTRNLTPPLLSGSYTAGAYQLFSADLSRALLASGWSCRAGEAACTAANPPLSPAAPPGYRNLYLREGGAYQPLITAANFPTLPAAPEDFQLALEGANPDLTHFVISADEGLYMWRGGQITLLDPAPGASLAAPAGAISADGARVYFMGEPALGERNLYLREGAEIVQVDGAQGGGGAFQAASADGSLALFTKAGHLYRYSAAAGEATDLTPGGEVAGMLGASADGAYVYYLAASGLYLDHAGATTKVAASADAANYPPATGTARVTADGTRLAFISSASLTGYANVGKTEVFVYDAGAKKLLCASCNPKGNTPFGPSSIPAARAAGEGGPPAYKPRALSADGGRLFFDSADALLAADIDAKPDVYEWQAQGTGGCAKAAGCIGLISSGRAGQASFLDASADGADVFFLANAALLPEDPDAAADVYDARTGGGFPAAPPTIPCEGDDCQGPPPAPQGPTPGTATLIGPANPPVHFAKHRHHRKHRHHGRHRHRHPGGRR